MKRSNSMSIVKLIDYEEAGPEGRQVYDDIDLPPVFVPLAMLVRQALGRAPETGLPVVPAACSSANCVA